MTGDESNVYLWINGELALTKPYPNSPLPKNNYYPQSFAGNLTKFYINRSWLSTSEASDLDLYSFRFYDAALSQNQIAAFAAACQFNNIPVSSRACVCICLSRP